MKLNSTEVTYYRTLILTHMAEMHVMRAVNLAIIDAWVTKPDMTVIVEMTKATAYQVFQEEKKAEYGLSITLGSLSSVNVLLVNESGDDWTGEEIVQGWRLRQLDENREAWLHV
jgi:hypothetical protein